MFKRPIQVFSYTVTNSGENSLDIHIDGTIVDAETQEIYKQWFGDDTSVSYKSFRNQVEKSGAQTLNVFINSPGGLVTDAMAIHDFLQDQQNKGVKVNTFGRGIIASAATYILMASNNPEMSKNSWFMIHNVSGGIRGNVDEIEQYAQTLRKFNDRSRDFYSSATGIRKEDISKMMNAETWLTADEAKSKGFIKSVTGDVEFTQSLDAEHWQISNTTVFNSYNAAVKKLPAQNQLDDMKKILTDLAANVMNAIKGIKPVEQKAGESFDQTALLTSIGEAISKQFENVGEQMETAVNTAVENEVGKVIDQKVKDATKDLTQKVADLESANSDLNQEIADLKAGNGGGDGKPEPKQIGKFV